MSENNNSSNEEFFQRQQEIYKSAYVTIFLVIINVLLFGLSTTIIPGLYSGWVMYTESVLGNGEFYRIFTATFLHADINHLFNNMLILLAVGAVIEHYMGHLLYFIMYILAGICGNLLSMAYEVRGDVVRVSLGASGCVMGIVGFMVVWIVINRKLLIKDKSMLFRLLLLLFFVIEACFFQSGANTQAHLGGFLTGFVFGVINIIVFKNRKNMEGIA
nr:rhomboid family intramembrane serine protease [uncultured Butyrivibrio sp.]